MSNYGAFSCNPIIFIDPEGNTDFYNISGDKIGSDGRDNGEQLFVFRKVDQSRIKRQVQQNGHAQVLTEKQLKNTLPVPSQEVMGKLESTYNITEASGTIEHGFVVGFEESSNQEASDVYSGTPGTSSTIPSFQPSNGVIQLGKRGFKAAYVVHSHPFVIRGDKGGSYTVALPDPSGADFSSVEGSKYTDIVTGYQPQSDTPSQTDLNSANSSPGSWVARKDNSTRVISFFNSNRSLQKVSFDKFKAAVSKIHVSTTMKNPPPKKI